MDRPPICCIDLSCFGVWSPFQYMSYGRKYLFGVNAFLLLCSSTNFVGYSGYSRFSPCNYKWSEIETPQHSEHRSCQPSCWHLHKNRGADSKESFWILNPRKNATLHEANITPANRPFPKGDVTFQPSIFKGYVSFREGNRDALFGLSYGKLGG